MNERSRIIAPCHLPVASEDLIARRALLNRVDTKFILKFSELSEFFLRIHSSDYATVINEQNGLFSYENIYFDTPRRDFLRAHHRGQRPRHKVRIRHHLSRERSFIELKVKGSNNKTNKVRMPVAFQANDLPNMTDDFWRASGSLPAVGLLPVMEIGFSRVMLFGQNTPERISIDTNVWFADNSHRVGLDALAIIEVKQARFAARSPVMRALRDSGATEIRVSKYVTGAQHLWPDFPLQRYLPRLRRLRRRIA